MSAFKNPFIHSLSQDFIGLNINEHAVLDAVIGMVGSETDLRIRIPTELKKQLDSKKINVEQVVRDALELVVTKHPPLPYTEVPLPPEKVVADIHAAEIPPGHFMRIPEMTPDEFERVAGDDHWEYLEGVLTHHSPESNYHNALLNLLNFKAKSALDPLLYVIRTSRVALNAGKNHIEPDLMIFDRDDFRKKKRKDGTESEIIDSAPLLVVEVVSSSSRDEDDSKAEIYLSKGVKEYWRIFFQDNLLTMLACMLKRGSYDCLTYTEGEVRSRVLPQFAVHFKELSDLDSFR